MSPAWHGEAKAMREYCKHSDEKILRLKELHGFNKPFSAYSWNREQTDVIVITARIAMAPSGRCESFYIGDESKSESVICETREEVFEQLTKWAVDKLERARNEHIRAFEALIALNLKKVSQ